MSRTVGEDPAQRSCSASDPTEKHQTYEEAVAVVDRCYPMERVPQKTLYALQKILEG